MKVVVGLTGLPLQVVSACGGRKVLPECRSVAGDRMNVAAGMGVIQGRAGEIKMTAPCDFDANNARSMKLSVVLVAESTRTFSTPHGP